MPAVDTVSKRDLNQHTASVLDRVSKTGDVVVTERGTPRWRVSQFSGGQDAALERLEREGRYTPPASAPAPWPQLPGGPRYTDAQTEALLGEMRGEH